MSEVTSTSLYSTKTFNELYSTVNAFITDYSSNPFGTSITTTNAQKLFYLLSAEFGEAPSMFSDDMFKLKMWGIIYKYGKRWEGQMRAEAVIESLSEDEILSSSKQVSNLANNPNSTLDEGEVLSYVTQQNVYGEVKSKLAGYELWASSLNDTYTDEFLKKFKPLFRKILIPDWHPVYATEVDDD